MRCLECREPILKGLILHMSMHVESGDNIPRFFSDTDLQRWNRFSYFVQRKYTKGFSNTWQEFLAGISSQPFVNKPLSAEGNFLRLIRIKVLYFWVHPGTIFRPVPVFSRGATGQADGHRPACHCKARAGRWAQIIKV